MNLSTAIRSVVKAGWDGIKNMRIYNSGWAGAATEKAGKAQGTRGGLWNDKVKVNIKAAAQTVQQRKFGKRPSHFLTTDDQTCKPEAHMVRQNEMTWFET